MRRQIILYLGTYLEDEIKEIWSVAEKLEVVTKTVKGFARVDIFVRDSDRKMLVMK